MERRPRIFPKELINFPQKAFQNRMPSVLLPCPPHRISPLWEQSKSRAEQGPHLSYQARITETSSVYTFLMDPERASSAQVLRHLAISSHLPHTDNKTMAVLLPCLHHQGLIKPSPCHKYRAVATVMPFPRSNFRAKKTAPKLTDDQQCSMPLPDHKNEPNSLLDLGYQFGDQSSPDHLPNIFPDYKNRTEAITPTNQKAPSPTTPVHKAEIPLCEGEKTRLGPVYRPSPTSQTGAMPGPLTTTQQTKTSLRHRRNQVRAATRLLGFTKKAERPKASTSSHCLKDWSKGEALKPPDLTKVVKKSHSDLCPGNAVSPIGCINPESRSLIPSSLQHDQKTRVTSAPNPGHQAEDIQAQVTLPMEIESWEEATPPKTDDQTITVAGQDHEATPVLNQDSPQHRATPTPVSEAKDLPDPNIHLTLQAEQNHQNEEIENQAIIPAGEHHETTYAPSVPQDTSPDQWLKLTPNLPHQAEATQCILSHVSVQTDQGPMAHASVQTEQENWRIMASRIDHQATAFIGTDHGTTPPLDLTAKMRHSGFNHHSTSTQTPEHQVNGSLVDTNPPVILQAGQDHLAGKEPEIDLEQAVFFTGQEHEPLYLEPQDKILPVSDQDPGAIPPMALCPEEQMLPEPGQQGTSLTNLHHLAKETQDHLACVSIKKEYEPCEIMLKIDQQATALIGQDHDTASLRGLESKDTLQPDLDHQTTSPPSLDHQAEDLSVLDLQLTCQRKIPPCEDIALSIHNNTTQLIDQSPGAAPLLNLEPQDKSLPASDSRVTTPSYQDHGIAPLLDLGPQNKTLPEPDSLPSMVVTSPHHPNKAIQDHILKISVQELCQTMTPRTGQQTTTLIGQDHGVTMPLQVLDTKDTFSTSLEHQVTFPPSLDDQAENVQDSDIQFTVQEDLGKVAQKTHHQTKMLGTIPSRNIDSPGKTLSASDPQTTTLRGQDHESTFSFTSGPQNKTLFQFDQQDEDMQSHVAKVFNQTREEPSETMPPRSDHQVMTVTDQDPMHLDPQEKSIPGPDQRQTSTPTGQNYKTTPPLNLGPQDKILLEPENCSKPLPHPCQLAGDTQSQTPQASLQKDREAQETQTALTKKQAIILKDQDHGIIPPFFLGPENKIPLGNDQQLSILPPSHQQAEDTPNHDAKILIQTEQEAFKPMPPRTDDQATAALIFQNYGTTFPVDLDPKSISPTDLDYWAISRHSLNQQDKVIVENNIHITPQVDLIEWETISQEKDPNHMNLIVEDFLDSPPFLSLDNQETTRADLGHWDTRPLSPYCQNEDMKYPKVTVLPQSEQDHWESIPQGIEPKAITLTSQAKPPLSLGLQDQIPPLFDHKVILQTSPEHSTENIPDSDIHVCPQMVQQPLETLPTGKGQQAATPSDQDPRAPFSLGLEKDKIQPVLYDFTYLSSPDYQSEDTPASNDYSSFQTYQDPWKTMPRRKDPQVKAETDLNHETTTFLNLGQDEALTGSELQPIISPSLYEQVEDTQSPIAHTSFHTDPEPWETFPPRIDNHAKDSKAQNNKVILPVNLDSQNIPLSGFNYQDTNMLGPDQQVGDIQRPIADILFETEDEHWKTTLPRIFYQQHTALKDQKNRAMPLLSLNFEDKTLPGSNLPEWQVEPTQSCNAHVSFQTEPRETIPLRIAHQATNHLGQLNGSASLLSSVPNQYGSNNQDIIPPIIPNHKPEVTLDCQTYTTAPSNKHCSPKQSMDFNHSVMSKSITNRKSRQSKQNPWCFDYIEPYTVNGITIPTETMHTIISSIPQERIKNDISKQILLRRMKVSSALQSGQQISSSYPICLICASWIPDDCPHNQRMKNSCEAKLLAIPTSLPSLKEEDMGVKFVLQTPQTNHFTFILPEMHYLLQMPPYHLPSSPADSMTSSMLLKRQNCMPPPVPERIKGISLLVDKYRQPGRRAKFRSQQSLTGTKLMREYKSREHQPRANPIFFRSLLERLQLRQNIN